MDPEELTPKPSNDSNKPEVVPEADLLDRVLVRRNDLDSGSAPSDSDPEVAGSVTDASLVTKGPVGQGTASYSAESVSTPESEESDYSVYNANSPQIFPPPQDSWSVSNDSERQTVGFANKGRFRLSPLYYLMGAAVWILVLFVLWRIGSGFVGSDFMKQVLSLSAPFSPIPAPDSAVVSDPGLKSALLVGAPLVLAVFWFAGAYQIDRTARKTFEFDESLDSGYPVGYAITAVLSVFPLLVFGVIGTAWGAVMLTTWAIGYGSWGSVIVLGALLSVFCFLLWLVNTSVDRL